MGNWTTEEMLEELKKHLGGRLVSVVLFGSAAGGDHSGKNSDVNLLVETKALKAEDLQLLSKAMVPWVKQGNAAPILMAQGHLTELTDVFPVEIQDMQHNHKVLYGKDPIARLKVQKARLRIELEHEICGKLLRLRTRYALTEARPSLVERLMVDSLSSFLVLFKGVLSVYGEKPPLKKMEALRRLAKRIKFDPKPFETLHRLKQGERIGDLDITATFEKYVEAIETVVEKLS